MFDCKAASCVYPESYSAYDGILIPGSLSDSYSNAPWIAALRSEVLTKIAPNEIPTVGICFGHQIIAHALGGEAGQNPHGPLTAQHDFTLTEEGRQVFNMRESSGMSLLCSHNDAILALPPTATNLATSATCVYQMVAYKSAKSTRPWCYTVQSHPEYSCTNPGREVVRESVKMSVNGSTLTKEEGDRAIEAMDEAVCDVHAKQVIDTFVNSLFLL